MEYYKLIDKKDISDFGSDFLLFVKKAIQYVATSVKKRWVAAIITFLIAIAAGIGYKQYRGVYYESDMACAYNNMHQKVYGEMIQKLDILASSGSYKELSSLLSISEKQAAAIISFKPMNAMGSELYEDFTDITNIINRYPFYIKVRVKDRLVFKPLQVGILGYLNNTPYRLLRNKMEIQIRNEKIVFLDHDISEIDSLISAYASYLKNIKSATDSISGFSNLTTLMSLRNDFEDKRIDKVYNNALTQSVELVHGFAPTDTPSILGVKYILLIIAVSLVVSCVVSVIANVLYGG